MVMIASLAGTNAAATDSVESSIDYAAFLGNHDMEWNRIPNRWEVAPYSGNGNVGFTFYQAKSDFNLHRSS